LPLQPFALCEFIRIPNSVSSVAAPYSFCRKKKRGLQQCYASVMPQATEASESLQPCYPAHVGYQGCRRARSTHGSHRK